jgi:AcrR family transcriptional regulator
MPTRKPALSPASPSRADGTRHRILEAAERLLRGGSADFSMRDLAAEAGVSFATPFNQFGSKIAIMQALSAQRITRMAERFAQADVIGHVADRVLAAVDIASAVMLNDPHVSRAVMGSLGAPSDEPGQVRAQSRALWADAIGAADGFAPGLAELGRTVLPDHLALAFRGVLSFWSAGEITDSDLAPRARAATAALLLGFVSDEQRASLLGEVRRFNGEEWREGAR